MAVGLGNSWGSKKNWRNWGEDIRKILLATFGGQNFTYNGLKVAHFAGFDNKNEPVGNHQYVFFCLLGYQFFVNFPLLPLNNSCLFVQIS